jgi:broad specificity phosphatase PhoE
MAGGSGLVKIVLVRHGETEWNRLHRLQGGGSDTPLNEAGKKQAEELARRLKDEKITAIYSSPLQRAMHTALALAEFHHLEVHTIPSLKEIQVGNLEGVDSLSMKARWDQILSQENNLEARLQGVEPIRDVQARAWQAIKDLAAKHPEGTLIVVAHYVVIMAIVCAVLDLSLSRMVHLKLDPGSITVFSMNSAGVARLELFNDDCHTRLFIT